MPTKSLLQQLRRCLAFAGRNGPLCLVAGVTLGLLCPALAHVARPHLGLTVFVFTLGAFLKVNSASLRAEIAQPFRNALILLWLSLGVPLLASTAIAVFKPDPGTAQGALLWALSPPSGAAAALAALLGLGAPLALVVTVAATSLAPVAMPFLAFAFGGYEISIDPMQMALRLLVIVGGAGLASGLLKRFAAKPISEHPEAVTGISVAALVVNGLAAMDGVQVQFLEHPGTTLTVLTLAYLANLGFQVVGAILFWRLGREAALTTGLISGYRNVSLAWAAVEGGVLPGAELYFAATVVAIMTCPAITRYFIARVLQRSSAPSDLTLSGQTTAVPVRAPEETYVRA